MAKYYIRWQSNPQFAPADPEERAEFWRSLLEMVRADLDAGVLTDWGQCCDASGGYAFSELSEADLFTALLKWSPYVAFDVRPVVTLEQCIESINKVAAAAQAK